MSKNSVKQNSGNNYCELEEKEFYDQEFLEELGRICRELSYYRNERNYGKKINPNSIKEVFLKAMKSLHNKAIYDYYQTRTRTIDIEEDEKNLERNSWIDVCSIDDAIYVKRIILPSFPRRECDLRDFAHEMGHIPLFENKLPTVAEYYEYTEALPILLEFFMTTYLDKTNGKDIFFNERLYCESFAARGFEKNYRIYRSLRNSTGSKKFDCISEMIESYKYLASSDLVFQLVDLFDNHRQEIIDSIADVVMGTSSMKEVQEHFSIETSYCKRLTKEYRKKRG